MGGGGQEGEEGGRKGKCARDEEEGRWYFRAQGPFAGVGDHLRWEEDGAHGGYEEDLGLHQEEQPQSGRTIKPDSTLKAIFPVASIDMLKIAGYVSKHLSRALGRAPAIQPKSSDVAPGSRVATSRVRLLS